MIGKLKFEGEYLDGKIFYGKVYNKNGNIEFIINNGNRIGKEYDFDGKLVQYKTNSMITAQFKKFLNF